jgi:hypothetical protein
MLILSINLVLACKYIGQSKKKCFKFSKAANRAVPKHYFYGPRKLNIFFIPAKKFSFVFKLFFKLLTLFLCFLYLLISEFLWFFNITLRSRSLTRISFRISLVNHGLSLYLTVTVLVTGEPRSGQIVVHQWLRQLLLDIMTDRGSPVTKDSYC